MTKASQTLAFLRSIMADENAPAAARTQAARTLLEVEGKLGKHQVTPAKARADLSTMSRAELLAEIERLRGEGSADLMRTQGSVKGAKGRNT